jgi:hypothetical protein
VRKKIVKNILICFICLLISCGIELLFFNYPGIRTYFEKNKDVEANYYIFSESTTNDEMLEYTNNKEKNTDTDILKSELENGNNIIFIDDINFPVSSVNFYYTTYDNISTTYNLTFTAYGNEFLYYKTEQKVANNDKEAYILFDSITDCYNIKIDVNTSSIDKKIDKILLNHPNFNILPIRILIIFIILTLGYYIYTKKIYRFHTDTLPKLKITILILTLLVILIFVAYIYINIFISNMQEPIYSDEYTYLFDSCNLQIKSILEKEDGNFTISEYFIMPLYEVANYNEHYYNFSNNIIIYLILLPFRKITGYYLNIYYLNLILLLFAIIMATWLYITLTDYFIKKSSIFNYILGYIVLILGSNILFARRIFNTDIAFLTNMILVMLAFKFAESKNKIVTRLLAIFIGITLGLLIFNTPTAYIYIILIAIILKLAAPKKVNFTNCFLAIIPIIIFILITSKVNVIRFNTPFEYGNTYNIKKLDVNFKNTNPISYYIKGLIETIIIVPNIDFFKFPFFKMDVTDNTYFLNEFSYEHNVLGLISFPIIWFLIFKRFLKLKNNNDISSEEKEKLNTLKFINIVMLFSLIILLINFLYKGISEIYTLETKFLLMIASILFILKNIENEKIFNGNTIMDKVFLTFAIINILIMVPISISTDQLYLYMINIRFVNTMKNLFMFWI